MSDGKKLNRQQLEAIKHKGGPLLVIAGAGTGKTTVITERIKFLIEKELANPSEILALTFTEKAAREMETRVDEALPYGYTQMWISTFHSFCDRVLRREALQIGLDPKYKLMSESETVQFIRTNLFKFDLNYFRPLGNPTKFIDGMIRHFSRLQDEDVTPDQYADWVKEQSSFAEATQNRNNSKTPKPKNPKLKNTNKQGNFSRHPELVSGSKESQIPNQVRNDSGLVELSKWQELAKAYNTYDELKVSEGKMDYGDLIVKTLQLFRQRKNVLKEYQKQFKYVLVDEFQDTNIAQNELAIIIAGKSRNANITVTGDDDQCLPAQSLIETPDGKKKIVHFRKGDKVLTAVGKGHTSVSSVKRVFKRKRKVRLLTFVTEDGKKITATDNHKMFCFIPAHYKQNKYYYVYLMNNRSLGWRVGITNNPPARLRLERQTDKIIVIEACETEQEARYREAYFSAKYGLPTTPFTPRPGQAIRGKWLTKLFEDIDTNKGAGMLAGDLHLELDSPQFLLAGVTRGATKRVKVNFNMCNRRYRSKDHKAGFVGNPAIYHIVQVETSNAKTLRDLKKAGFKLIRTKKGKRFRYQTTDLKAAWKVADKLVEVTGGILDKKFSVGKYNFQHLPARIVPASHIFPGMYIPILKGREIVYKKVISRKQGQKNIYTYDLEVEKTHNFIADGVVVHNSIYRFRGAAVSNIVHFRKAYPKAKAVVLTKNYRSTQEILDRSYDLIQFNNPDRLEVVENIDKRLKSMPKFGKVEEVSFIHSDRVENEAESVAKQIESIVSGQKSNVEYRDFAILVRANNHSEPFIRALSRHGIPYQFLGPGRLFKQPEIVDLISYLKVLYNFEDNVSMYRLLNFDYFDIEVRDLIRISNFAKRINLSLFEACEKAAGDLDGETQRIVVSDETKRKLTKLLEIIGKHQKLLKKESAGQILYYFLEDTGLLQKLLNPDDSEAEKKAKNISKFFDKLKTYEVDHEDASVFAVVDWIDLASELGESPLAGDTDWTEVNAVNILTIHSAKGLEFPVVFLVNLVGQRFPTNERREQIPIPEELIKEILPEGDSHTQEERRLFYVGMTRAKEKLYFTAADYYGEGKREKKLSPFIFEALGDKTVSSEKSTANSEQLSFLDYSVPSISPDTEHRTLTTDLHIDYLSYSQIETFRTCPLHYKLKYILRLPTPPSAAQSFGTSMHIALREFYESVVAGEKPTEKLIMSKLEDGWISDGYASKKHEERSLKAAKNHLVNYLDDEFDAKHLPVALEKNFTVPLPFKKGEDRLRIGGKIDRVDLWQKGKDGGIEIVDYKTGANIPTQKQIDHNLQLTFYALAANSVNEEPFNKKPGEIRLSLYYFDGQQKITTTRTQKELDEAVEEIYQVRNEIINSDFKCSGHMFCQNCEYKLFCQVDEK